MNKLMFIAAGLTISSAVFAQKIKESDVPTIVKDAFRNSYKDVKDVKWEKEGVNFEAECEILEIEQSVVFDPFGQVVETEIEIQLHELPTAITHYIANHYKTAKIEEASKITQANGIVTYEVEIKNKELIFDSAGKFIREEGDKAEGKD